MLLLCKERLSGCWGADGICAGKPPKKLAVLVSGGGTNFQSILDSIERGEINAQVSLLISSNAQAYAIERAEKHSIPVFVCAVKDFESREKRDEKILELLSAHNVDYVLLAGYLGIVSPPIIERYRNKIVNIHPALLPSYGGKDYYGINVHRAVIAAKEPFSGATVHFVDEGTDTGLIIAQEKLPVLPSDTAETLQQKILEKIEHKLFPRVVRLLCDDRVSVRGGKVVIDEK